MKKISILFSPTQTKITQGLHALSSAERMVGLLKHSSLNDQEAMIIDSCKQVHTLFMKFAMDAIFVSKAGVVVGIEELKPWRFSKIYWKANYVIETNYGWAKRHNIKLGSTVEVTPC
jgi:uncharacterized protein